MGRRRWRRAVPPARFLPQLPRQCRKFRRSGAGAGRAVSRARLYLRLARFSLGAGLRGDARPGCPAQHRDLRHLPHPAELCHLPRRCLASATGSRHAPAGADRGAGARLNATVPAPRCGISGRVTDARRAPPRACATCHAGGLPRLPPRRPGTTGRRRGLPSGRLLGRHPAAATPAGPPAGLPQHPAFLRELPLAGRAERNPVLGELQLPRWPGGIHRWTRSGGPAVARVVCLLSCGTGLHGMSLIRGPRIPVQPARTRFRTGAAAAAQSRDVHRLPRSSDPGSSLKKPGGSEAIPARPQASRSPSPSHLLP
jgi:hypothetical protein